MVNLQNYQTRITDIEARILEDTKSYMEGPTSKYFLGAAIISFYTEEDKIKALSIFERSGWLYRAFGFGPIHTRVELLMKSESGKTHQLWLEKAFAPQDIIWEHLGYSNMTRFIRKLASLLLSAAIIVGVFFLILAIKTAALTISGSVKKRKNNKNVWTGYIASVIVALAVLLIDFGLQYLFNKLSRFERHSTITVTERNVTRKIWIM